MLGLYQALLIMETLVGFTPDGMLGLVFLDLSYESGIFRTLLPV